MDSTEKQLTDISIYKVALLLKERNKKINLRQSVQITSLFEVAAYGRKSGKRGKVNGEKELLFFYGLSCSTSVSFLPNQHNLECSIILIQFQFLYGLTFPFLSFIM